MYYGYFDVFDWLWFLGWGGISKVFWLINISEDIFVGFNCIFCGGIVIYYEYI